MNDSWTTPWQHAKVAMPKQDTGNARLFWLTIAIVAVTDAVTKHLAHTRLARHVPLDIIGEVVRIALAYNPGAAFGLHVGPYSRWFFLVVTLVALVVLYRMYRDTPPGNRLRVAALALISGGALGNLINRLWSSRGVVDFIDVGVGDLRWPTFNVADIGVSLGAILLGWLLWREDRRQSTGTASG